MIASTQEPHPDGTGYTEKYYFNPGDTGFRVWPKRFGNVGVAICWDRVPGERGVMALQGATSDVPDGIAASRPTLRGTRVVYWRRVMQDTPART